MGSKKLLRLRFYFLEIILGKNYKMIKQILLQYQKLLRCPSIYFQNMEQFLEEVHN